MKVPTLLAELIPQKKKQTPLQKLMQAVKPKKKRLPGLKKELLKKWRKSPLRKKIKAHGKKPMFSFKKRTTLGSLPALLVQRMP